MVKRRGIGLVCRIRGDDLSCQEIAQNKAHTIAATVAWLRLPRVRASHGIRVPGVSMGINGDAGKACRTTLTDESAAS